MATFRLLPLCLAASVLPVSAQVLELGSQTGQQIFFNDVLSRSYNFGITNAGGSEGLTLSAIEVNVKGSNAPSHDINVYLYDDFGGTGNLLATGTILLSNLTGQFQFRTVNFNQAVTLTQGSYSVVMTTGSSTNYFLKDGALQLQDSSGLTLTNNLWVQDSNTTGTAGTSLAAANNVLAEAVLGARSVNFGNFRIGDTRSQTVSLTNGALATSNNVTEELSVTSSSASAPATVSGLPAGSLAQGANTNFTVALNTATAGVRNGTITLNYGSVKGSSASTTSTTTSVGSDTINVTGTGYRAAVAAVSSSTVDLGKFHVGASDITGSTTLSNTATADGYSEGLGLSQVSATGGTSASNLSGLIVAGANRAVGVGLANVSTVGANTGVITLGVVSSGSGTSGLANIALDNQFINVTATGYSGQATWNVDANGTWNSFDGWDNNGGKPGVDGSLSLQDTATFGAAATSNRTITLGDAIPTLRSLTFNNASANYYLTAGGNGRIQLGTSGGNGALAVLAGNHTVSAGIEFAQSSTVSVASGSSLLLSGALTGSAAFAKNGLGRLDIDATNSFSGNTSVNAGLLVVNGSLASSGVTVGTTGTLGGSGTVGSTSIASGGTLAPGNSPGTLNVEGNLTWSAGGNYNWQVVNASGVAGVDWDLVEISGNLDLSALSAQSTFAINLWTLASTGPDVNGFVVNFNNNQSYTWTIARVAGAIIGFDASDFTINLGATNGTSGWANELGGGSIAVVQNGQDLNLVFSVAPIPEPSTYGLLLGISVLALAAVRRRKNLSQ